MKKKEKKPPSKRNEQPPKRIQEGGEPRKNNGKKLLTAVQLPFLIPCRFRSPPSPFFLALMFTGFCFFYYYFSWKIARMRMILWTRIRLTFWSPEKAVKEEEMLSTMVDTIKGMVGTAMIKGKEETTLTITITAAMAMSTTKVSITTMPMAGIETATLTAAGMLLLPMGTVTLETATTATTIARISTFTRKQNKTKMHANLTNKQKKRHE